MFIKTLVCFGFLFMYIKFQHLTMAETGLEVYCDGGG